METQNNKNIDQHFRKLAEEQKPKAFKNSDAVWDKIEEKLDQKQKRRVIPFWKYASVAAALLLLITLGSRLINNKPTVENNEPNTTDIVVIDQEKIKEEFDSVHNLGNEVVYEKPESKKITTQGSDPIITEDRKVLVEVLKHSPPIIVEQENVVFEIESKVADVETIASREINSRSNATFLQTLQGQVPGLKISKGSRTPGKDKAVIGTDGTIVLKGNANNNTKPLYVIDGVLTTEEEFRKLNPNDIESVVILKEANATALYGNRAANGVIAIQSQDDFKKNGQRNKGKKIKIEEIDKILPLVQTDTESYDGFIENQFESAKSNPVSTFSIDVDNASYTNIRRFINNGQTVPKDAVRIEEMINFFKYDNPKPTGQHPFSIHTQYSDAPWNPNHKLVRIALQGKEIPTDNLPKSNFVFLVDVSGSMEAPNKLPLLKSSMKVLLDELRDDDRVSIVYYASGVGVLLEPTKASEKAKIIKAIDNMRAGGGTSGAAGLELAYQMAEKHFVKGGNNRIILATDGDFNIGKSSDKDLQELIEEKRKSGVFLTCLGFGMGNYKDSKMTTLSKKGNGNYAYIDNIQEANRFLGKEFKGSMYAIAKDVKIQIEFNPTHVQAYRLIGYEMRKLRNEDFTNDAIDAGELGSGHTVTALYEVIPNGVKSEFYMYENDLKYTQNTTLGQYQNELATVKFRYKKPDEDKSTEMVHTISNQKTTLQNASKDFKFATAVAWFGLKLRDSQLISNKDSKEIIKLAKEGLDNDTDGYKAEFIRLVESVK
jgi:Ca-activated chloride channel family protein